MTHTDGELLDLHRRASAFFGQQVAAVAPENWDLPTPCDDWNVQAVVAHVVVGDAQIPPLLAGQAVDLVDEVDAGVLGVEPLAVWRGTALAAIEAFAAQGVLDTVVHHPIGDMPARHVLGFRVTDSLIHGWDLATALRRDTALDDDIVQYCLAFWTPMASRLAASGYWKETVPTAPSADDQTKLLALLGRQS